MDNATIDPHQLPKASFEMSATPIGPPQAGIPLPCVLPQTSKSIRGTYFSPFVRAYVPGLAAHGIDQDTFLTFVDGLNEAFIAHPVFEAANIVGAVIATFGVIHPVQWAGMGVALTAVGASKATSYGRTKAYLKAVNVDLFNPVGLKVSILNTKKMMEQVGFDAERLNLPALDRLPTDDVEAVTQLGDEKGSSIDDAQANDPRMRRIRALEGYVMPLDFDVPAAVSPDNLFRRMGDAHAQRLSRKQQKTLAKKREKGVEKYHKEQDKAEEERLAGQQRIAQLERKLVNEQNKFASDLGTLETAGNPAEKDKSIEVFEQKRTKIEREIEKEKFKMQEKVGKHLDEADSGFQKSDKKEDKIANKIRWIVISKWTAEKDSEDLSEVSSDDSS